MKQTICDDYLGTCRAISLLDEEYYNLSEQQIAEILEESEIFCCEACNWWYEFSEMAINNVGDRLCSSCYEDENGR